jgi:hypothetical protein
MHMVARKSRWASAGNSAGVRMVSIFILRRAKVAKAAKEICGLTTNKVSRLAYHKACVCKLSNFQHVSAVKTNCHTNPLCSRCD